jgi:hypothetical protein
MKARRDPWWLPAAALLGSWCVRGLGWTWRFEVVRPAGYADAYAAGERFVYVFWHSGILPLAMHRRDQGIAVLVSQHHDGELIARLIARLGYVTARGSSTRGGERGVRELIEWAERGRHLAITPDGPRGPAQVVKSGTAFVAARVQRRVVPIGLGVRHAWRLRSWDRFRVPKPFARVTVHYGEPVAVSNDDDSTRATLERALLATDAAARTQAQEAA